MSTINKLSVSSLLMPKISDSLAARLPDLGATKAMNDLAKNNPGNKSISGQEMADAILAGTRDTDNQAAGKEYAVIKSFVEKNGGKLSPEAKKVFETYEKAVNVAKANGQTGIDARSYAKLERDLQQAGKPRYADKTSAEQLKDLAAKNKTPGSISGQEMTDAILKGTKDTDGQAAGKEFRDIEKFVRENKQLLSPEAKAAYAVYEKAAKAAQAKGQTGIDDASYQRMARDMARASGPRPSIPEKPVFPSVLPFKPLADASAAKALTELSQANPGPGSISGNEMAAAIKSATQDLDGQAAGAEYRQIAAFVKANEGKLSPEAKAAFAVYQREAKAAISKGQSGIDTPTFEKMCTEMEAAGKPKYQDAGMGAELNALAAANTSPGSITAKQLSEAISKGARDLDGNSAGKEFEDLAKFIAENQQLLTPDAKAAFALYEKAAMSARSAGSTSVGSLAQFDALVKQMASVGSTATAAPAGPALPKAPLQEPIFPGPNPTQAELEQFSRDFAAYQATLPPAPAALSGIPMPKIPGLGASQAQWDAHGRDIQRYSDALKAAGFTPLPGLVPPFMPGPKATAHELATYANHLQRFIGAWEAPKAGSASQATASTGSASPSAPTQTSTPQQVAFAGGIEDRALQGLQGLKEPQDPGPNATEQQLATYQRDLGKYNRMFEMYSKIMANAHEMKKSLIANFPR